VVQGTRSDSDTPFRSLKKRRNKDKGAQKGKQARVGEGENISSVSSESMTSPSRRESKVGEKHGILKGAS